MINKQQLINLLEEFGYSIPKGVEFKVGYAELESVCEIKVMLESSNPKSSNESLTWEVCLSFVKNSSVYTTEKFYLVQGGLINTEEFSRQEAETRRRYQQLKVSQIESDKLVFIGSRAVPVLLKGHEAAGNITPTIEKLNDALVEYYGGWREMLREINPDTVELFSGSLRMAQKKYKDYLIHHKSNKDLPVHFEISLVDDKQVKGVD